MNAPHDHEGLGVGHTPGPWEVIDGVTHGSEVVAPAQPRVRRNVAKCGGPRREANARLIASAPALLEALEVFSEALGSVADTDIVTWPDAETIEHSGAAELITWGDLRRARAAISAAKGPASNLTAKMGEGV